MKQLDISICIPTYNRRKYLKYTIDSIFSQIDSVNFNNIEICISDNCSTDGTSEYIKGIQINPPIKISYRSNATNIGADANFLSAVEMAQGKYCWLMGSDDAASPGSINKLLQEIKSNNDIYLCNRIDCDSELVPIFNRYWLDRSIGETCFNLNDQNQFEIYSKNAKSIGAFFSYLSSIIFKRSRWISIKIDEIFIGTAYSHVYMLLSFIKSGCNLKYIPDHLVLCRGGNDGFLMPGKGGGVDRIILDINGYSLLAKTLFYDNKVFYFSLLRGLKKEHPEIKTIILLRYLSDNVKWKSIKAYLHIDLYSQALVSLIGISRPLMILLKKIKDFLYLR